MAFTIEAIQRAMNRIYNPPVRGLTSKRARIRKKAEKRLKGTFRWLAYQPNPLLRFFPDTVNSFRNHLVLPLPLWEFVQDNQDSHEPI